MENVALLLQVLFQPCLLDTDDITVHDGRIFSQVLKVWLERPGIDACDSDGAWLGMSPLCLLQFHSFSSKSLYLQPSIRTAIYLLRIKLSEVYLIYGCNSALDYLRHYVLKTLVQIGLDHIWFCNCLSLTLKLRIIKFINGTVKIYLMYRGGPGKFERELEEGSPSLMVFGNIDKSIII